jgi:CRP-like cAMP-binding protein
VGAVDSARLAGMPLFEGLDDRGPRRGRGRGSRGSRSAPGPRSRRRGAWAWELCVIEEGEVGVRKNGRQVRTLRSGDVFGEIGLPATGTRTATVTALTDVRVAGIFTRGLEELEWRNPDVVRRLRVAMRARAGARGRPSRRARSGGKSVSRAVRLHLEERVGPGESRAGGASPSARKRTPEGAERSTAAPGLFREDDLAAVGAACTPARRCAPRARCSPSRSGSAGRCGRPARTRTGRSSGQASAASARWISTAASTAAPASRRPRTPRRRARRSRGLRARRCCVRWTARNAVEDIAVAVAEVAPAAPWSPRCRSSGTSRRPSAAPAWAAPGAGAALGLELAG